MSQDWINRHPATRQLHLYKHGAKERGLVFELTLQDFKDVANKECHYCGLQAFGYDRADNDRGYIRDNVVPCCTICNRAKSNLRQGVFLSMCRRIAQRHAPLKPGVRKLSSYNQIMDELYGD